MAFGGGVGRRELGMRGEMCDDALCEVSVVVVVVGESRYLEFL